MKNLKLAEKCFKKNSLCAISRTTGITGEVEF